jgi:hypothetical protein
MAPFAYQIVREEEDGDHVIAAGDGRWETVEAAMDAGVDHVQKLGLVPSSTGRLVVFVMDGEARCVSARSCS